MENKYATGGVFSISKDYQFFFGCRDGCVRITPKGSRQEKLRIVINQEPISEEALRIALHELLRRSAGGV